MVSKCIKAAPGRLARVCLLWISLWGSVACTALRKGPTPPDLTRLQPGDVVLTFQHRPELWLAASGGGDKLPQTAYDHGEILALEGGDWVTIGISGSRIRSANLIESLPRYSQFAVYRAKAPLTHREKVALKATDWHGNPSSKHIAFDYFMRDVPGRRDKFYCIGFVNEVCRDTSLPAPFFQDNDMPGAIARHFEKATGIKFNQIIRANSLISNPQYERVMLWENDQTPDTSRWLSRQTASAIIDFYEQGWLIKPHDQGLVPRFMGKSDKMPQELVKALYLIRGFSAFAREIESTWLRLKRRGKIDHLTEQQKVELHQTICLKYRDRYFVKD